MKSKICLFVLSVFIVVGMISDTVQAGSAWHRDGNGWWYQEDNWYPSDQWYEISGNWYYFSNGGYIETSAYRDGCWLDSDGSWNKAYSGGHWASDGKGYWYTDNSGWYPSSTWLWIDGKCYYFKNDGYMAEDEWVGDYYLGSDGAWVPGVKRETGSDKATEVETGKTAEVTSDKPSEVKTVKATEVEPVKATKDTPSKAIEDTPSKATDVTPSKTTEVEPSKTTEVEPVKVAEVTPDKASEEVPRKKAEDTPNKASEDISSKTTDTVEEKSESAVPSGNEEEDEGIVSQDVETLSLTVEGKEASLSLAWNPISDASGYRIYLGSDKNSLGQVAVNTSREDVTITFGYMTAGTYYAKVVGYKDVNGTKVNLVESDVVMGVVKSKPASTQPSSPSSSSTTPASSETTTSSEPASSTPSTSSDTAPSKSESTTTQPQVTVESNDSIIKNVLAKTNDIRRGVGKDSLKTSAVLTVIAQKRAEHMVQNNYFSHYYNGQRQLVYWRDYYGYSKDLIVGENIAKVYPGEDTSGSAVDAWVKSPGHYSNIIDSDYVTTGIAVAKYGDGMYVIVQVFSGGTK